MAGEGRVSRWIRAWDWLFVIALVVSIPAIAIGILWLPISFDTDIKTINDAANYIALVAQVTGTFAGFLIVALVFVVERRGFSFRKQGYFDDKFSTIAIGLGVFYFSGLSLTCLFLHQEVLGYSTMNNQIQLVLVGINLALGGAIYLTYIGVGGLILIKVFREFYGFEGLRERYRIGTIRARK
ncbi:MAG: hypothetical protein SA339_13995 [Methanomassiliicoccus sp.]|nr:hypothetical protein [Methanomassiliicoccus sp.]